MAQRDVLAGAGGVLLGAARTDHAGRRAVLVVRGEEDTTEFTDLAKTMGIDPSTWSSSAAGRTLAPTSAGVVWTRSEMCSAVHHMVTPGTALISC